MTLREIVHDVQKVKIESPIVKKKLDDTDCSCNAACLTLWTLNPLSLQPPSAGLPSQIQENTGMLLVSCKNW